MIGKVDRELEREALAFITRSKRCSDCAVSSTYLLDDRQTGRKRCAACLMDAVNADDIAEFGSAAAYASARWICAYCGELGEELEHVVPRSSHLPTWTVRACRECNGVAGGKVFDGFAQKRDYIRARLRRRYATVLRTPEWTADELNDLRGRMKNYISACAQMASWVRARVAFDLRVENGTGTTKKAGAAAAPASRVNDSQRKRRDAKQCKECRIEFSPLSWNAVFCSPRCARADAKRRREVPAAAA